MNVLRHGWTALTCLAAAAVIITVPRLPSALPFALAAVALGALAGLLLAGRARWGVIAAGALGAFTLAVWGTPGAALFGGLVCLERVQRARHPLGGLAVLVLGMVAGATTAAFGGPLDGTGTLAALCVGGGLLALTRLVPVDDPVGAEVLRLARRAPRGRARFALLRAVVHRRREGFEKALEPGWRQLGKLAEARDLERATAQAHRLARAERAARALERARVRVDDGADPIALTTERMEDERAALDMVG